MNKHYHLFSALIIIFLSFLQSTKAQIAKDWDYRYGGTNTDKLTDYNLVTTPFGAYFFAGRSTSPPSGDKGSTQYGNYDYWVVRADANGSVLIDYSFGGSEDDYLTTMYDLGADEFFLGGYSKSDDDGVKSATRIGTNNLTNDFWVVKVGDTGSSLSKIWDKTYGSTEDDQLHDIVKAHNGNYILAGFTRGSANNDVSGTSNGGSDYWIVEINGNGNVQWERMYSGDQNDELYTILPTSDGGYLLGGKSESDITSGHKIENSQGGHDFWVIKIDATGNIMWDKTIGGANTDVLKSIYENGDGSFMLAGWSNSGISGDKTTASNGSFDYWLVKIDATGNILWDRSYGGSNSDYAYEIIKSNDGNFVLAGKSASDMGGDKSENSQGTFDYWILGVDENGNTLWDKTFGGDDSEDLRKIYEVTDNEFVLIGSSSSSLSGDKSQGNQSMSTNSDDYWILKTGIDSAYIDSLALIELYDSLDGDNWTDNTNWKTSNPISTWYGVSVNTSSNRVDSLILNSNNLADTIPTSINKLNHLTYINFQSNNITGSIPFLSLSDLEVLKLSGNSIGGNLQDYDLPKLEIMNIGGNNISGAIPNFSNMNNMRQFYFHNNELTSVPPLALPNLTLLRVSSNQLSGAIPDFTGCPSLVNLNLSGNQLSGTIPTSLNSMPNLQYLRLYDNNLSGDVPDFTGLILSTFRIEENNLNNMPDASHMISLGNTASNSGLQMDNNAFTFEDIIVNAKNIASASIIYSPQDSIGVDSTIDLIINEPLNINLAIDDTVTTNIYTWFRDGNIVSTTNTSLFTISVVALSDAGTYTCQVTNPNAPNLTLQSRSYVVTVLNPLEVTNTNDSGTGSLREAISYANNQAGNDTITFNISAGSPPFIIQPTNNLPSLTDNGTVINATSQPSYNEGDIQLDGQNTLIDGISILGNNCEVYGIYFYHYTNAGVQINGGQNAQVGGSGAKNFFAGNSVAGIHLLNGANNATIRNNYCGTAPDLSVFANGVGVLVDNSDNVTVFNNILSGNTNSGIEIDSSDNLTITSNKIGVKPDGITTASNGLNGITITGNSTDVTIGGSKVGDPNLIAYNNINGYGISLNNDAFNVVISQNQIYCNDQGGIQLNDNANNIQGMPTILEANNTKISGIATSNAVIEIFENDNSNCTGITTCQGKTYLGSVTADGTGAWSKSGNFTIGTEISTTATDPTNGTSNFSSCITIVPSCAYTDSLALVELYDSTDGANWTNTWNLNQSMSTWYGVILSSSGCVETLDLDGDDSDGPLAGSGNNLVGTLPDLNLSNTIEIYLSNNQLSGDIPNFSNLSSIFSLYLFGNNFSNTALPDFSNIPSLNDLDLSNNNLSGTIPDFSVLGGLSRLNLASNNFSGTVPDFNISILTELYLANNQLDSCPNFNGLLSLSNLVIKNNQFTFDDIVPNVGKPTGTYDYSPQDSTGTIRTEIITLGNPYTIELGFDSGVANSTYSWFKNGTFLTTTSTNKYTIPNATLADEGQYDVQVTNSDASGLTLNVRPITLTTCPVVNIGKDTAICSGVSIILDAENLGATYLWSTLETTQTITVTPSISTTYTVTVTSPSGCMVADTIIITVNDLPTASVSGVTELCLNETTTLNGNPSGGSGMFNTHTWTSLTGTGAVNLANNNDGTVGVTGTSAGIVTLEYQVTDDKGCSFTTTYNLTINDLPTASVSGVTELCLNETTTLNGNPSGGSGTFNTHTWTSLTGTGAVNLANNNDGTVGVIGTSAGIVTLEYQVTDDKGCSFTNNYNLTVNDLPTITMGNDTTVITASPSFNLSANPSGGIWAGMGIIDNSLGTFDPSVSGTGVFRPTYTISDGKGCVNVDSLQVIVGAVTCAYTDSLALVDLYNATNGANWTNTWDLAQPMTTWYGVSINAFSGCVDSVKLQNNNLVGTSLPNLDLANILTLSLDTNQISGTIPNFSQMPNLEILALGENDFSSSIPDFNSLNNLKILRLDGNSLSGTIPDFNLSMLKSMILHDNQLDFIPNFSNLPSLESILAYNNNFIQTMPLFDNLPLLENLSLYNNQLTGAIPDFANSPNLKDLALQKNNLTSIPNLNLTNLESLFIGYNELTDLPIFTNLSSLQVWDVANNQLTFEDIEPNLGIATTAYVYAPQDSVGTTTTAIVTSSTDYTINHLGIDNSVTTNTYYWYLNGVLIDSTTTNQYTITNFSVADVGTYYAAIQNSNATNLTLDSRTITLSVVAPTIQTCRGDTTLSTVAGLCTQQVDWLASEPIAVDLNNNVVPYSSRSHTPNNNFSKGVTTVTYVFGNEPDTVNCSFNIIINDEEKPSINCPSDTLLNTNADVCYTIFNLPPPTATDNCGVDSIRSSHKLGDTLMIGTTTIQYIAVDLSGNEDTCAFNITIEDAEKPVFTSCPTDTTIFTNTGNCFATFNWMTPIATDNCGTPTINSSHTSGSTFAVNTTTTVTHIAEDANGNRDTCSFNITVLDNEKPVFTSCPTDTTIFNDVGNCFATFNWMTPTATDNCGMPTINSSHTSGSTFAVNTTTTVTHIAEDANGNRDTCSFNITVLDNEKPTFTNCPTDIILNNDVGQCYAIHQWTPPTATDNCGMVNITNTHNPGDTFYVGTTTPILYIAEDSNGNRDTCTFNITVLDNESPSIVCPNDLTIYSDANNCNAVAIWVSPTITDNCDPNPTFVSSHNSGDVFTVGTHTIKYTVNDIAGNVDSCEFTITVLDTIKPVFGNLPADTITSCETMVNWLVPTVSDSCGIANLTSTHQPNDVFPIGTTDVTYTATDINGNNATFTFKVIVHSPVNLSINGNDVSCFGANDGQATITPINGTSPYTYLWSNAATTTTITNLPSGTYTVTATDANTCIDSATIIINTPDSIAVTMTKLSDVFCHNGNNGSAAAIVTGGTGGFSYLWDNGEFTAQTNTLTADWHYITITDGTGCTAIDSIEINEPIAITATIQQIIPVQCAGQSNGSAEVQPTGGNAPYTYLWDNGETTDTAFALNAGLHNVTVTDATGCTEIFTITIGEPDPLQVTQAIAITLVSCNGGNDGIGTFTVIGGTAPYSYNWSNGETTDTAFALTMGAHQVTITDANGCIIGGSLLMNGPTALTGSLSIDVPLTCNGNSNGEITASISGGTTPYSYQWNTTPTQTTATATGLGAGTYKVTVSDANNCLLVDSIDLIAPNLLSVTVISQDDSCGRGIGVLSLNVGGGTSPYTYAWGGILAGQNTSSVSGLSSNTYPVTITDANGCTSINNYLINDFCDSCSLFEPLIFSNNTPYTYNCIGNNEAEVLINVEGGKPEFDLNNGGTSNYTYTLIGSSLTADGTYADPTGVFSFMVKTGDNWSISIDDDLGCGGLSANGTFTESVANCSNYCNLYPIQTKITPSDQDTIILINNDVPISVTVTNPDSLQNYTHTWSPTSTLSCSNCSDPIASPHRSTRYDVVTMNDSGCARIDTIFIKVVLSPNAESFLTIQQGITANNDGINDVFVIDGLELFPKNELIIINRWGNVVYTAKPYKNDWRGTFQGTTLPEGTYYYILRTDLANSETLKGSILIIR